LRDAIQVDAEQAHASFLDDEINIKRMIEHTSGAYNGVNKTVCEALRRVVVADIALALDNSKSERPLHEPRRFSA